jgi:hypothetical protein
MKRLVWFLLLPALILSACVEAEPNRTCEQISHERLRGVMQQTSFSEQVAQQVSVAFDVPVSDVLVQPAKVGNYVSWKDKGIEYQLLVEGTQITLARVSYLSAAPSGEQLFECLGVPAWYWGYYYPSPKATQRLTQLTLFYPEIGGACWMHKYGSGERPPSFAPTDAVAACDFVPPTPAEQVVPRILSDLTAPSSARWVKDRLREWPTDWRDIVVVTESLP